MRRTASSVLRDLEIRVARLEKRASKNIFRLPNIETVDFSPAGSGKQYQFEKNHDVSVFDMNKGNIRLLIKTLDRAGDLIDGDLQRAIDKKKDILLENFNMIEKTDLGFFEDVVRSNPRTTFYLEIVEDRKFPSNRYFD
tara:strand:+ start:517 stop:933 length:417 start_codon:yes stop_codon:yes gene_type:complete